jgi:hypothetical protein
VNSDRRDEKPKKTPLIELADSINRSMIGNLGALAEGGCLSKIIVLVIIISAMLMFSKCAN